MVFKHYHKLIDVTSSSKRGCTLCAQFSQDASNRAHKEDVDFNKASQGLVTASYLSQDLCQLALEYKLINGRPRTSTYESSVTMVRSDTRGVRLCSHPSRSRLGLTSSY